MSGNLKLVGDLAITAEKVLFKVCSLLKKKKIPYVLEGGTLLGIIRENRLLPWDNDVDITITDDYLEQFLKLRKFIWLAGYRTRIRFHKNDIGPFKKGQVRLIKVQTRKYLFDKGNDILDVFVKSKIDGKFYWAVGIKNPTLKSVDARYYENFSFIEFKGKDLSIPLDYDDYLTTRYGNWREPVKEWDFQKDDKAIVNIKEKK